MDRSNKLFRIGFVLLLVLTIIFACEIETRAEVLEYENVYHEIFEQMDEDDYLQLERVVYWEAARAECPLEVEVAVVETVMNRVLDGRWGYDVSKVCKSGEFVCKYYISERAYQDELVSDAIEYVMENGPTVLPSTNYMFFATKKQSLGKNHILIGTKKGHRMWFCEEK